MIKRQYFLTAMFTGMDGKSKFYNATFEITSWFPKFLSVDTLIKDIKEEVKEVMAEDSSIQIMQLNRF